MRWLAHIFIDTRATAAAELALVLPLLLLILFGSSEVGRYFYNEHILVKAVRDGAVYASRQPIDAFHCATGVIDDPVKPNTRNIVQTGALASGANLLPQWAATSGVSFTMTLACVTAAGGTTLAGIYSANGGQVPVITVTASLPYRPVTGFLGSTFSNLSIKASQQASVVGI